MLIEFWERGEEVQTLFIITLVAALRGYGDQLAEMLDFFGRACVASRGGSPAALSEQGHAIFNRVAVNRAGFFHQRNTVGQ